MPRTLLALALGIALALGGCLRNKYDLCGEIDPHPECDAGAPPRDAGSQEDAGSDAGSPEDAGSDEDAGAPDDAGGSPEDAGEGAAD